MRSLAFLKLYLIEFDSFDEREVDQRKLTIKRRLSMMQPRTQTFDVYSMVKSSWKSRKLSIKLCLEPSGRVTTVQLETDDSLQEPFLLSEVHQIIWTDLSATSNPTVTFVFREEKRKTL